MKQQHTLQPKLRFPEFEGDWEKKKFINYVKLSQGLQIPISERYTENVEGSYFYITNEFLNKNSKNKYYILNPSKSVLCTEDDILMTRTGNTGKVVTNVNGAFHNNFFRIAYNKNVYKDFLYYFLINPKVQHIILSRAGTSTIPDLNHSDFYSMYFSKPSLPEQQKIADYLSTIDTKINLLDEKKAQLALYKKAMMQKLFSQEIRFKDDNGNDFTEWEEKRLEDVFTVTRGQVLAVSKLKINSDNIFKYPVYSSQTRDNGLTGFYDEYLYQDAITWTTDGANAGTVLFRRGKFYCTNVCGVLISNEGNSNNCIAEMINMIAKKYVSYVGNPKLMNNVMAKIKIYFPSVQEQQKIADFLSAIDESIEKVNEQITQTQSFKKAMLQQMFV